MEIADVNRMERVTVRDGVINHCVSHGVELNRREGINKGGL